MSKLKEALQHPVWIKHKLNDTYTMDGKPDLWKIAYYPLFCNGKTLEQYEEPRALMEKIGEKGFWSKEAPLRYLSKTINL